MELEGHKWSSQIFEANGLIVNLLITDRHTQIKAFAAKEGNFEHNFYCWHISKCKHSHEKVKAIILNKALLRDMPTLSTSAQTFGAESFHSMIIQYAPKATHFHYSSMVAR
ncbi:uncharacterized protein LOC142770493 [Rhipicephalus microplus]|uniref:uncharacterized protein LOC142770493 n=1 Tax=Rhipicephalus microplus TaxID=6941 RepID=UPI003F6B5ABB